jgi:predicted phage terminase large subunit-like protein
MQKLNAQVIETFVGTLLKKTFDSPTETPDCHREWWTACCLDEKYVAIAAPRGFAKSTAITHSYTLAKICFREAQFVVIVADTEAQAILFLNDIKKELMENDDLRVMFGVDTLPKDSETDIIVRFTDGHLCKIVAKGSGKAMRGLKWRNLRPDLVVCDDMENDELVMNKDRRDKHKKWFAGTLMPILSDKGCIRIVGTILHADSLLESFMPKLNDKFTRTNDLKVWATHYRGWYALKYRAHNKDFTKLLWPDRKTKEVLMKIRDYYESIHLLDVYSQEYLHHPIDESNTHFRRSDFLAMTDEDRGRPKEYYITMDLAVTTKAATDYSVFMVWGVDSDSYIHVENVIRQRMDSLEIVNTIFELVGIYDPVMVVTEKGTIANSILPAIYKRMDEDDTFFPFELLPSTTDKLQRSQAIRLRARAGRVKCDKEAAWWATFEDEVMMFPRSAKDDQVDAFSLIGHTLNKFYGAKPKSDIEDEEYEEQYRLSGLSLEGRNELTGY